MLGPTGGKMSKQTFGLFLGRTNIYCFTFDFKIPGNLKVAINRDTSENDITVKFRKNYLAIQSPQNDVY